MNNLLRKIGLDEKMARNFWAIIIVAFGGAIIYGLPYFRYDYYDAYLEVYNLTDTQTMDDYLKKNNTTLDDLKKSWKTSLEKQIKVEFIFGRIADLEDIQVTDDDFKQFVDYLASSGNSQMTTESEVYDYYGNGNQEDGKKMLRQQYRINKAISYVVKQANVTVEPATESTEN